MTELLEIPRQNSFNLSIHESRVGMTRVIMNEDIIGNSK